MIVQKNPVRLLIILTIFPLSLVVAAYGIVSGPLLVKGAGIVMVIYFLPIFPLGVAAALRRGPALVLDNAGLTDRASVYGIVRVRWEEIASVTLVGQGYKRGIRLTLYNPAEFEGHLRWHRRMIFGIFGGKLTVGGIVHRTDIDALLAEIERHLSGIVRG